VIWNLTSEKFGIKKHACVGNFWFERLEKKKKRMITENFEMQNGR
jgi:hypothetical protein